MSPRADRVDLAVAGQRHRRAASRSPPARKASSARVLLLGMEAGHRQERQGEQQRRGQRRRVQASRAAAAQDKRGEAVGEEQQQRRGEQRSGASDHARRAAQSSRARSPAGSAAIGVRRSPAGGEVERAPAARAAVEPGGCCGRGVGLADLRRGDRAGMSAAGSLQLAEAVERLATAAKARRRSAWRLRAAASRRAPDRRCARSISTNRPESGRFDQSALAVTWNSTTSPCPAARGDQRRAVLRASPRSASARSAIGLGQHLAGDRHIRGIARQAGEGAVLGERRERLRRLPGQRAAERAAAGAQPHRQADRPGAPAPGAGRQSAAARRRSRPRLHQAVAAVSSGMAPISASTSIDRPASSGA